MKLRAVTQLLYSRILVEVDGLTAHLNDTWDGSDIAEECINERCNPVVSKCVLNESNKLVKLLKTNGVDSYSPLFPSPRFSQEPGWQLVENTGNYLQLHQCLPLPRKRSPDGASPDWGCTYLIAAYYSFIYLERMKGWVGLVGRPTADGLPT